jgi:hypothetical protein
MYQVPSEFMKQKNTIAGPITVAHGVGAFGGYFLAYLLGGSTWLTIAGVALGLALTTVKVQGLALYRFAPIAAAFLLRKLTDDTIEPEEETDGGLQFTYALLDGEGKPILFQEES